MLFFAAQNPSSRKGSKGGPKGGGARTAGAILRQERSPLRPKYKASINRESWGPPDIRNLLKVSRSTVCRSLRKLKEAEIGDPPRRIVALMDATYRGWNFGVVAIKDHLSGRVVWFKFIDRKEKIEDYVEGVRWLENRRAEILGIVSDGLRGLRARQSRYKFQYCRFYQVKTVKHRLTSRPKLEASRELLDIVYFMAKTDKASFVWLFAGWEMKWKDFLKERSVGVDGKSRYVHRTLRSAYHSVKRNMPYLWTFEDCRGLRIPNTNNGIESLFTEVKGKLKLHRGLSKERRKALISGLLIAHRPYRTRDEHETGSPNDT